MRLFTRHILLHDRPLEAVLSNSAPIPAAVVAQPFQAAMPAFLRAFFSCGYPPAAPKAPRPHPLRNPVPLRRAHFRECLLADCNSFGYSIRSFAFAPAVVCRCTRLATSAPPRFGFSAPPARLVCWTSARPVSPSPFAGG